MRPYDFWKDRLNAAACLCLCVLPFLFLVVVIFFGARAAWASVAVAFVGILLVCNSLCKFPTSEETKRPDKQA